MQWLRESVGQNKLCWCADASASSDWTAGWTNWDPKFHYKDADDTLTLNGMRYRFPFQVNHGWF
ncbi:MAG: hypothetical protein U0T81_17340 [Saprospiraceae bacterium]